MHISALCINRPIATTLLSMGVALLGIVSLILLPVAPVPPIDLPVITVSAGIPGASPQTMATSVAMPLERTLGQIAGVNEITSSSTLGKTSITLQFDIKRDINGAARDVQAGINAAKVDLPSTLKSNPTYRKSNPADSPIMILELTSAVLKPGEIYDVASNILSQKISQLSGVGNVNIGGGALPAVRVELNPFILNKYEVSLAEVSRAIKKSNVNLQKGGVENSQQYFEIATNDQAKKAADYSDLIVAYRHNQPIQLKHISSVIDGTEDSRNAGISNGHPAILLIIYKQPNANVIKTVNHIYGLLPSLKTAIPSSININVAMDTTTTIRASLREVTYNLWISIVLVVLVVYLFLRNIASSMVSCVAIPLSLLGTFSIMYICGYTLNNLSLMALTIATGFIVDDAIVVLENIKRHMENGLTPKQAALQGGREIGFTVFSISLSLIAVFIPIFFIGGTVGLIFHEFAIVLSTAILVSLVVSLSTTPMMCAMFLKKTSHEAHIKGRKWLMDNRHIFKSLEKKYIASLDWTIRHAGLTLSILLCVIVCNMYLYITLPKGFFPTQDTGVIMGSIVADQSISFEAIRKKLSTYVAIIEADPAVENAMGFVGGNQTNTGRILIALKPLAIRKVNTNQVINRLRKKLSLLPGAALYLQARQDIRTGARFSNALYQYTLQGSSLKELDKWTPKVLTALQKLPQLKDVNTSQQDKGQQLLLDIDHKTAKRLGVTSQAIDQALYDAFGQQRVSTIYEARNQYQVIMEVDPQYAKHPSALQAIYVPSSSKKLIPLSSFATFTYQPATLIVTHQALFPAVTLSFNLAPNIVLSDAIKHINKTVQKIGLPNGIQGTFQGTAKTFQESFRTVPFLLLAALISIYIVLGILYESLIHPLTILSTLPSAGVGALLALKVAHMEFSLMAFIGVILLIGIVKKNAIMMIDFALVFERQQHATPVEAIKQAAIQRFRPIIMTTAAAMLGAVPLAFFSGTGSELRQPLGITVIGGLLFSQLLTLYTTPVVYLYLNRFQVRLHTLYKSKK